MDLFAYDPNLPLDVDSSCSGSNGLRVEDLSYASPGGRVTAYLAAPIALTRCPAIILLHGGGQNRSSLFPEARELAKDGWVCLSLDAPFARPEPHRRHFADFADPHNDREVYVQTVLDLRRAVDLLDQRTEVDATRIGYIGMSYGATVGIILSTVEPRVSRYVLVAPVGSMSSLWRSDVPMIVNFRRDVSPRQLEQYIKATQEFDAAEYVSRAPRNSLFMQFAERDELIPRRLSEQLADRAPAGTLVRWYDTNHHFDCSEARDDREAWLKSELAPPLA
jgi:dienelactone hydrolase